MQYLYIKGKREKRLLFPQLHALMSHGQTMEKLKQSQIGTVRGVARIFP